MVFRLGMSIMFATIRASPSTAAMVQLFVCVAMLILLMYQKPYRVASTYHLDVLCYTSLIVQFALEIIVRESDSFGVSLSPNNPFSKTVQIAVDASFAMRYVSLIAFLLLASLCRWRQRRQFTPCTLQVRPIRRRHRIVGASSPRNHRLHHIFRFPLHQIRRCGLLQTSQELCYCYWRRFLCRHSIVLAAPQVAW